MRAADYYGVSVDYLLGRSMERNGSAIRLDDVPDEDAAGQGNQGLRNLLPILNKKLICNSVTVVEDILGATEDKELIDKVSLYLQICVYQMFRRLYNGNAENPQTLFGAEDDTYDLLTDSALKRLQAEIQLRLKQVETPVLDEETIRRKYPMFATSLFHLLQNAESAIGGRKK